MIHEGLLHWSTSTPASWRSTTGWKDEGVEPDFVTYDILIFGLPKAGMVDQASKFLNVMTGMGVFPDTVSYTSLMIGMCRKGDRGAAGGDGCERVRPNEYTRASIFMDRAMEMYATMRKEEMKLQPAAYATLMRTLCRESRIAEGYEVFDCARWSRSLADVSA